MHERLRMLREREGLSRAAFGARIGVSSDTINNLERGRSEFRDTFIKLICSEFFVNENWLRTGEGEMYSRSKTIALDSFCKEHNASSLDIRIMKAYFSAEPNIRHQFVEQFLKYIKEESKEAEPKKVPDMSQDEIHDKAMEIAFETERQLSMEKKPMEGSSASATTQAV